MTDSSNTRRYPPSQPTSFTSNTSETTLTTHQCDTTRGSRGLSRRYHTADPDDADNYRPRVRFSDADAVRQRVFDRAAELKLRCGTLAVLNAVLTLLCSWSRIRDDKVRLSQLLALFPAGTRQLSLKTVGRLLAQLHTLELITYRPAHGRGACAEIAIHPAFLTGVCELQRTKSGTVLTSISSENVTFAPLIGPKAYPPTPRAHGADQPSASTRPVEVDVDPAAVRRVLAEMPEHYRQLPSNLRWKLGALVRQRLARGFLAEQILAVLRAPAPEGLLRPFSLARHRLMLNMPGVGPRLKPLQTAWDAAARAQERARVSNELEAKYAQLRAELPAELRARLAAAVQAPMSFEDTQTAHKRAVVSAARIARREHPNVSLSDAAKRWLSAREAPTKPSLTVSDLLAMTPSGRCVACGSVEAAVRDELPLPTPVCAGCWDSTYTLEPDGVAAGSTEDHALLAG